MFISSFHLVIVFFFVFYFISFYVVYKFVHTLYIWSGHYARNVAGFRLFDHQKPSVMPSFFFLTFFTFCYFFLLLVTFVNYFLLLKGANWIVLFCLLIVEGEGLCLDFLKISFTLEGEGGCKLMFFFLPSFDMWKEEGKGDTFF